MARDLIPPPSPAGRPSPDPGSAGAFEPLEEPPREAAPEEPVGPSQFRGRFGFMLGLLAGCGLAAAVLLVVLLGDEGSRRPAQAASAGNGLAAHWSPWHPRATDAIGGAEEIADKLGGSYKDAKEKSLTRVKGGLIALNTVPIQVAVPAAGDRFQVVPGLGVQYTLGGFGRDGRLEGTTPSEERRRLLRREALELSLYSFRYLPGVDMVVALLPPAPKAEQVHTEPVARSAAGKKVAPDPYQRQALFWRRADLRKQLETPLTTTMALKAPKIDSVAPAEAKRIDRLTLDNLYTYDHIQQQDGSIYLVLDRPS
jgi:hypothetical protein